MNTESKSFVKVFFAGCLWGTIGLFVKLMENAGSSAAYTSFVRLLFGFLLLVVLTLIFDGAKAFRIGKRTLISCILLGIVSQGLYNILYSRSISLNGMAVASVLLYTAPVFTGIMSALFFKEKLTATKCAALLVNVLGCVLTATGGKISGAGIALTGVLFGVGAGLTYAMIAIFGRIAMQEQSSPFAVATYNLLFGCIFVAIVSHPWTTVSAPLDAHILLIGLLYALIPTAAAYVLYFGGLSNIKQTSKVTVVASVELIVATGIGAFVFKEAVAVGNILGIALVLLSIFLFNIQKPLNKMSRTA